MNRSENEASIDGGDSRVIDIHCHLATPATRELAAPHARPEYEPYDYFMGAASIEHNRTMMLHWTRDGEPDLYLYEMIQLSDDGNARARVWQWFRNDRLMQRTLIDEHFVTRDWAAYEDLDPEYADIGV